jgi:hypothetical protein
MHCLILRLAFLILCLVAALVPLRDDGMNAAKSTPPDWPEEFERRALRRLPLSEVEERFNAGFPGHVARFNDGERELIFRWIHRSTRKLHSSADCFRGLGYTVAPAPALQDAAGQRWSSFTASRGSHLLRVRECIIEPSSTKAWSDVSAWYWSTLMQQTRGPWLAMTVVELGEALSAEAPLSATPRVSAVPRPESPFRAWAVGLTVPGSTGYANLGTIGDFHQQVASSPARFR